MEYWFFVGYFDLLDRLMLRCVAFEEPREWRRKINWYVVIIEIKSVFSEFYF